MLKYFLIAVYIFSVLYCYLQLNMLIDRCVAVLKERHPLIPMDEPIGWRGLKLTAEILLTSAIPVANIGLGYFCDTIDEPIISEIINNVESNHWTEILTVEQELASKLEATKE